MSVLMFVWTLKTIYEIQFVLNSLKSEIEIVSCAFVNLCHIYAVIDLLTNQSE